MNRTEFVIAIAVILFVAFVLGWLASWLMHRLTRVTQADMNELDDMARNLHEAQEERDQAVDYYQAREKELSSKLAQAQAELAATMEGLKMSRHEAEELRAYIEKTNQAQG